MRKNDLIDLAFDTYREFYPSSAEHDIEFMTKEIYRLEDATYTARRRAQGLTPQHILEQGSTRRLLEWLDTGGGLLTEDDENPIIDQLGVLLDAGVPPSLVDEHLHALVSAIVSAEIESGGARLVSVKQFISSYHSYIHPILYHNPDIQPNSIWSPITEGRRKVVIKDTPKDATTVTNMAKYLCDAAICSITKTYGFLEKRVIHNTSDKGPWKHKVWTWDLAHNNNQTWQQIFNQFTVLNAKSIPMLAPPKPYKLDPSTKRAAGGGYITDLKGDLLTNYQNQEVRLKSDYSHGKDYIDLINNIAKIPAFIDLQTLVNTLRAYNGMSEELVLEEFGKKESIESFKKSLIDKGGLILKTYINSSEDSPVWEHLHKSNYTRMLLRKRNSLNKLTKELNLHQKNNGFCISTNRVILRINRLINSIDLIVNPDRIEKMQNKGIDVGFEPLDEIHTGAGMPWDRDTLFELEKEWIAFRIKNMVSRREEVWWVEQRLKCKRILMNLIILAATWDKKPIYFVPVEDYRGRAYAPGETNHINSKLFRRFCCVKGNNSWDNIDMGLQYYYIMSQYKKYYSIEDARYDFENKPEMRSPDHGSVELDKIEASLHTGIVPTIGFDATSSVCQHWGILSGDTQMMIDSNVILDHDTKPNPKGKDIYTILLENSKSIKGLHKIVANRAFMKAVVMQSGYSSQPKQIAFKISKDYNNPNSLWNRWILQDTAKTVVSAFKKRYPIANSFKNSIQKYGKLRYQNKEGVTLTFKKTDQTVSYCHYKGRNVRITQKPPRFKDYIRADINMYDTNIVQTSKGNNSTFVNLIHIIDSRVLKKTRYILKKEHNIDTHGIHDCFMCNLADAPKVIGTYNRVLMESLELNIEDVLEGYEYPKKVKTALEACRKQKLETSQYSLMPT